ncbi:MAG: thymidylate kinase [Thermaerobacter sp.]|nr:thymidylate kinase [Thermaerobacter sp.]
MPRPKAAVRAGGLLIAVEGCDGSGKSTQIQLLYRYLLRRGFPVHLTSWNSSPAVHPLQRKAKRARILTPLTFSIVNAADFADRYEREIQPRLSLRQIVLCDRYVGTAYARDGARGVDPGWIERLYSFARPADLTLFFHAPAQVAADRIMAARGSFSYYEAGLDLNLSEDPLESFLLFQGQVLRRYEEIEQRMGYVRIDATRRLCEQQRAVRRHIDAVLQGGEAR